MHSVTARVIAQARAIKVLRVPPEIFISGDNTTINKVAGSVGALLAAERSYFRRDIAVVSVEVEEQYPKVRLMDSQRLRSEVEQYAQLKRREKTQKGFKIKTTTLSKDLASAIMASNSFRLRIPEIKIITSCPVLVERRGKLVQVTGFDPLSGIYAGGGSVEEPPLDEAVNMILGLLHEFRFASAGDLSRAVAALIGPAMKMGNLLNGRLPLDVGEADDCQAGKGFRNKLTAAVYNDKPHAVTQRKGGVGCLEERFDDALILGRTFITWDNIRGRVDSTALESFLTEDTYVARIPYLGNVGIDPSRYVIMFTSNKAELTKDLSNRMSCVRILKQPQEYQFQQYGEGDFVSVVRSNWKDFLGAVFTIVRHWYNAGRLSTGVTGHDFRAWAGHMDWIVQNTLKLAPLLEGHRETQDRITSSYHTWLRDVMLAIKHCRKMNTWLRVNAIADIISQEPNIELPGVRHDQSLDDDHVRSTVFQAIGRRLSQCFNDKNTVEIDNLVIHRRQEDVKRPDGGDRKANEYRVEEQTAIPPTLAPEVSNG